MRDFRNLYSKGKSFGNKFLMAKVLPTKGEDPIRFAFIISNKTEKSAVKRNKAKRQAREIIRLQINKLKPGFDVAITIKASFLPLSYQEKEKQVNHLLKQANLYL